MNLHLEGWLTGESVYNMSQGSEFVFSASIFRPGPLLGVGMWDGKERGGSQRLPGQPVYLPKKQASGSVRDPVSKH